MRPLLAPAPAANLVVVGETDSTNELAARIIAKWGQEEVEEPLADTVVVAAAQVAGRGRGTNAWQSPPGGLYATWLGWVSTEELAWLPLAAGVALAEAVEAVLPAQRLALKWPNDLVVDGRKLAGILAQSRISGDSAWAVVGFGVNVEVEPRLGEGDPVVPVSLRALGLSGDLDGVRWAVVGGFLSRLRPALAGAEETRARWAARSVHRAGDRLRVRLPDGDVVGAFAGFGPEGQLLLTTPDGTRTIAAGEIVAELPG